MEVVVVGGGVGGLYAATSLSRSEGVGSVQVIEAQESVGGRMRTHYGADGSPLYEEGAWRISSDHILMMQLCADLGLDMLEVPSEGIDSFRTWLDPGACDDPPSSPPPGPSARSPARHLGTLS